MINQRTLSTDATYPGGIYRSGYFCQTTDSRLARNLVSTSAESHWVPSYPRRLAPFSGEYPTQRVAMMVMFPVGNTVAHPLITSRMETLQRGPLCSMKDSFDYLRIAENCLKQASAATDDVIRAQWTQLADRWRTLAARIAESEHVMGEYEEWRLATLMEKPAFRVEQVKN